MEYSEYTSSGTEFKEYYVRMSDGVRLRIFDFIPEATDRKKPVIIFVAGWISLISGWKGVLQEITPHFRTIYMETREKRSSLVPQNMNVSFAMDRLRNDIGEVIDELIPENQNFFLAGSSLGASAILEYCALNQRTPECAFLIGPNAEFRFPKVLGDIVPAFHPSLYFAVKPVVKWYLKNFRLDKKNAREQVKKYENTLDEADPYKLKANALAIKNYTVWDKLGTITTPCVILGATSDTLHGTGNMQKLIAIISRTEYIELASNTETHSNKAGKLIAEYIAEKKYRGIPQHRASHN
jgi:pimeloyl-ACP methyl ester carboxylesterase